MKNVDFEDARPKPDPPTLRKTLDILEELVGPAIHAKSVEEEAETAARLVVDRDDLPEVTLMLLGMVVSLMDVVTVISGRYTKPCDYYHYIVDVHEQELASYN